MAFVRTARLIKMWLFIMQASLTPEQHRFAIRGVPTLIEVSGFSYFYGAFMVGPQFSMTQYQSLVKGELTDVPGQRPRR